MAVTKRTKGPQGQGPIDQLNSIFHLTFRGSFAIRRTKAGRNPEIARIIYSLATAKVPKKHHEVTRRPANGYADAKSKKEKPMSRNIGVGLYKKKVSLSYTKHSQTCFTAQNFSAGSTGFWLNSLPLYLLLVASLGLQGL
jgi:hypothetical protein